MFVNEANSSLQGAFHGNCPYDLWRVVNHVITPSAIMVALSPKSSEAHPGLSLVKTYKFYCNEPRQSVCKLLIMHTKLAQILLR